jgi:hypothetical protein
MNHPHARLWSRGIPVLFVWSCFLLAWFAAPASAGDGYFGSEACASCHPQKYNDFRLSGHPYKLVPGDEASVRPIPTPAGFEWDDITYVIGGYRWKSRYLGPDGYIITRVDADWDGELDTDGMNQYNYLTRRWVNYHAGEMKPYDCGSCHTTGWVPDDDAETDDDLSDNQDGLPGIWGTFAFGGVQCEACHGAGSHFGDDFQMDGSKEFCGTCHVRGDPFIIPASGGFIRHHEQYNEQLAGSHAALDCTSCHDPHMQSATSIHTTCEDCHAEIAESYEGTVMDDWDVTCEDCHMARASKSADALGPYQGDVRTHLFWITPSASAELFTADGSQVALDVNGQAELTVDFACLSCHTTQTRGWAAFYADNFHGPTAVEDQRPRRSGIRLGLFH